MSVDKGGVTGPYKPWTNLWYATGERKNRETLCITPTVPGKKGKKPVLRVHKDRHDSKGVQSCL